MKTSTTSSNQYETYDNNTWDTFSIPKGTTAIED